MTDNPLFSRGTADTLDAYAADLDSGRFWGPLAVGDEVFPVLFGSPVSNVFSDGTVFIGYGLPLAAGGVSRSLYGTTEALLRDAQRFSEDLRTLQDDLAQSGHRDRLLRFGLSLSPYPFLLEGGWKIMSSHPGSESDPAKVILHNEKTGQTIIIDQEREGEPIGLTLGYSMNDLNAAWVRSIMGQDGSYETEWYHVRMRTPHERLPLFLNHGLPVGFSFSGKDGLTLALSALAYASGQYPDEQLGPLNLRFRREGRFSGPLVSEPLEYRYNGHQFQGPEGLNETLRHFPDDQRLSVSASMSVNPEWAKWARRFDRPIPDGPLVSVEVDEDMANLRVRNPNPASAMPLKPTLQNLWRLVVEPAQIGRRDTPTFTLRGMATEALQRSLPAIARPAIARPSTRAEIPSSRLPIALPKHVKIGDQRLIFQMGADDNDISVYLKPSYAALAAAMFQYRRREGEDWGVSPMALEGMLTDPKLQFNYQVRNAISPAMIQLMLRLQREKIPHLDQLIATKHHGGPWGATGVWQKVSWQITDKAVLVREALHSLEQWELFYRESKAAVGKAADEALIVWIGLPGESRIVVIPHPDRESQAFVSPIIKTSRFSPVLAQKIDTHRLFSRSRKKGTGREHSLHHELDLIEGRKWLRASSGRHELIPAGTLPFAVSAVTPGFQCLPTMAIL